MIFKHILLLYAFLILNMVLSVITFIFSCKTRLPFNQPYILHLEKVSPEAILACQKDSNCMDVLPIDDLPKRGDAK